MRIFHPGAKIPQAKRASGSVGLIHTVTLFLRFFCLLPVIAMVMVAVMPIIEDVVVTIGHLNHTIIPSLHIILLTIMMPSGSISMLTVLIIQVIAYVRTRTQSVVSR